MADAPTAAVNPADALLAAKYGVGTNRAAVAAAAAAMVMPSRSWIASKRNPGTFDESVCIFISYRRSQNFQTPTVPNVFQIGLCGVAEAEFFGGENGCIFYNAFSPHLGDFPPHPETLCEHDIPSKSECICLAWGAFLPPTLLLAGAVFATGGAAPPSLSLPQSMAPQTTWMSASSTSAQTRRAAARPRVPAAGAAPAVASSAAAVPLKAPPATGSRGGRDGGALRT